MVVKNSAKLTLSRGKVSVKSLIYDIVVLLVLAAVLVAVLIPAFSDVAAEIAELDVPDKLQQVVANATSVAEKSFSQENKFVKELLKRKLVDVVASDYHFNRENFMAQAYARVKSKFGEDYAKLIFDKNPTYIATVANR